MNTPKAVELTADRSIPIHIKLRHIKRIFALAQSSQTLVPEQILNAAIVIGLRRLEGGEDTPTALTRQELWPINCADSNHGE